MKQQKASNNSNNRTCRSFIFSNINKKKLEEKSKENLTLAIKKIRKCRLQKKKFLVQFKQPQRINYVKEKFQTNDVINAITAAKTKNNNEKGNFSEEDYSNNSASYMEMEQVHQIQQDMQKMQQSYEKQLLDLKHQLQQDYEKQLLDLKRQLQSDYEKQILGHGKQIQDLKQQLKRQSREHEKQLLELKHQQSQELLFKKQQFEAWLKEQQAQFQNQLQEPCLNQLTAELQRKLHQYESQESKDILKCLTEFNNYSRTERIQNKIFSFVQKIKIQKYNETKLIKDEGEVTEYQILAQIVFHLEKLMEQSSSSRKPTPFKQTTINE